MKITEFLLARIAEDEETARAGYQGEWETQGRSVWGGNLRDGGFDTYDEGGLGSGECNHMVRWQPARALRECEAKRRIASIHACVQGDSAEFTWSNPDGPPWGHITGTRRVWGCDNCTTATVDGDSVLVEGPCSTLRALAAVYADHPDYDPEWTPVSAIAPSKSA